MKHEIGLVAVLCGVLSIGTACAGPDVSVGDATALGHAKAIKPGGGPGGGGGGGSGGGGSGGAGGGGSGFDPASDTFNVPPPPAPDASFDGGPNGFAAQQAAAAQAARLSAQARASNQAIRKKLTERALADVGKLSPKLASVPTPGATPPNGSLYAEAGASGGAVNRNIGMIVGMGTPSLVANVLPAGSASASGDSQMAGTPDGAAPAGTTPDTLPVKNVK